jgi:hypothetical protein
MTAFLLRCMSPLMAHSRHPVRVGECPLTGAKRTSKFKSVTSAFDQSGHSRAFDHSVVDKNWFCLRISQHLWVIGRPLNYAKGSALLLIAIHLRNIGE